MDGVRMRVCVYESIQGLAKKKKASRHKKRNKKLMKTKMDVCTNVFTALTLGTKSSH
jgi:hypothetical protein